MLLIRRDAVVLNRGAQKYYAEFAKKRSRVRIATVKYHKKCIKATNKELKRFLKEYF